MCGKQKYQTMNDLAQEIRTVNAVNGWAAPYWDGLPTSLCLVHSEVSEALEGYRVGDTENVHEELADVIIRVLDICAGLGVDIDAEVQAKVEKNRNRAYKHGGKSI